MGAPQLRQPLLQRSIAWVAKCQRASGGASALELDHSKSVFCCYRGAALVSCAPLTGRTHQVNLASAARMSVLSIQIVGLVLLSKQSQGSSTLAQRKTPSPDVAKQPACPLMQIRVHLGHAAHPIIGDDFYGVLGPWIGRQVRRGNTRHVAQQISLPHWTIALSALSDTSRGSWVPCCLLIYMRSYVV